MFNEGLTITKASKAEWIGDTFHYNGSKDTIVIGGFAGFGGKHIPCKDIKEFKLIDEKSTAASKKKAVGTVGGALVGGLLTGGIGAVIGGMAGGNDIKKDLKIDMGFKLKSKEWFVGTLRLEDQKGFTGSAYKMVVEAIVKRFAVKETCPF